jgi:hypothetical protein
MHRLYLVVTHFEWHGHQMNEIVYLSMDPARARDFADSIPPSELEQQITIEEAEVEGEYIGEPFVYGVIRMIYYPNHLDNKQENFKYTFDENQAVDYAENLFADSNNIPRPILVKVSKIRLDDYIEEGIVNEETSIEFERD